MHQSKQARIDELERTLDIEQEGFNSLQKTFETKQQEFKDVTDKFRFEARCLQALANDRERLLKIIENLSARKP